MKFFNFFLRQSKFQINQLMKNFYFAENIYTRLFLLLNNKILNE